MPVQGNEDRRSSESSPRVLDHHVNEAFSNSQGSDLIFRSFDSTNVEDTVSDGETYARTRCFSESHLSDPENDRTPYDDNRRAFTPQARRPLPEISQYSRGRGKFSQRCINQNLHLDFKHVNDPEETPSDSNCVQDDAMDIKKEDEKIPPFSFRNFSRKKKFLALSLMMANFAAMFCLSVMAPFFPQEASSVGVSDTVSGWIFGVFALVQFLTSPIFGKVIPKFGAWFLYQSGLFLAAGCTVLFGFMSYMPVDDGGTMFIIYCFALRMFMALGCSALATAEFTLCGHEFADYASVMFGIMETFGGVGLMIGPAVGGFLYAAWGFPLPFIMIGGVMFLIFILNHILLPDGVGVVNFDSESTPVTRLLRIPSILLVCLSLIVSASVWSVLDPVLEPHLRTFDLGSEILGLLFLLMSASYAISAPIWGWLSEKTPDSKIVILIGFFGCGIVMMLLGPSPLLGFADNENILWLNIVSLLLLGIATSMAVIPTFESILDSAELAGLPENMGTYATVAGLWGSLYALGDFVGPVLGGALQDTVGFQWCTTYIGIACLITGFFLLVLYLYELKFGRVGALTANVDANSNLTDKNSPADERRPLLGDNNGCIENHIDV